MHATQKSRKGKNSEPSERLTVRKSDVHGRGVYTTQRIAKGTRIIEYTGKRVLWDSIPEFSDDQRTFFFGLQDGKHVIDPSVGGNEARWINHSCDPNCEAIEENGRIFIYALRNLRPGEELFYDYALEMDEPTTEELEQESACHCGSAKCRGTMLDRQRK